jgi:hypothetical protein
MPRARAVKRVIQSLVSLVTRHRRHVDKARPRDYNRSLNHISQPRVLINTPSYDVASMICLFNHHMLLNPSLST